MKIGILTYHKSHNYGALLQAIALRYKLDKMGHEVFFIDYWPRYHRQMYSLFSLSYALSGGKKKFLNYMKSSVLHFKERKDRICSFKKFIKEYIVPYCIPYSNVEHLDVMVYGSDQIWRKQPGLSNQFNPVYFAQNILSASKHISYAASMGVAHLDNEDYKNLKRMLSNFSSVSVREQSLHETLDKINVKSDVALDPTLLLSAREWDALLPIPFLRKGNYILYYRLLEGSFDERAIREFANKQNCHLIILDSAVREKKENVISIANPLTFLSLVKYANFVFTSSYHGLVFSLIFEKQFCASFITNKERAESLLKEIGLEDRLLQTGETTITVDSEIDYAKVNPKIEALRKHSMDFLTQSL